MPLIRTALAFAVFLVLGVMRLILPLRGIERLTWTALLRLFRVRVVLHGQPVQGGALMLANHISWIDIAALGRVVNGCFIAKAEVSGWPVVGPAARRIGCLFVDRSSRRSAHLIAAQLGERLDAGCNVIVFPEGTTGPGDHVLPFRSTLTGATTRQPLQVQPIAMVYRTASDRALAAWLGDAALLPHALALARSSGVTLDIWFEQPFIATDRKMAAAQAATVIANRLASELCDQAAALKRAA